VVSLACRFELGAVLVLVVRLAAVREAKALKGHPSLNRQSQLKTADDAANHFEFRYGLGAWN
jgi:hypothetical protein